MNKYLNPLSRALLAAVFIASGFGKVAAFQQTVAMAGTAGLPMPAISIAAAALIEIVGGLALLAGWQVRWASLALLVFLIPTTLVFHASHLTDPVQGRMQMVEVLKNLAIMGGLLKYYVDATGGVATASTHRGVDIHEFPARRAS
jgi:putative oxidoreductase